jgi:hypothetical protein
MTTEETGAAGASGSEKPKARKKATAGQKRAHVAPKRPKAVPGAKAAKKAPKPAKKADEAREGSKTARILDLLKRPGGVTLAEIMKVADWQAHSIRGFISGTLVKKMGLSVVSTKADGQRTYAVKA